MNKLILLILFFIFLNNTVHANNIKNSAVVFMYHKFGQQDYPSTNIRIDQFEQHLEEFSKSKYNVRTKSPFHVFIGYRTFILFNNPKIKCASFREQTAI